MKNLFLFLLIFGCVLNILQAQDQGFSNYSPTLYPDRIMLTIPGDPASTRAVSWRTIYSDSVSIGEITIADPAPALEISKKSITGTFSAWEEGSQNTMGHKVIFENLKPKTKYAYRVGDGKNWSEWFQFETSSDKAEPFSFLYFGDMQNDIKSYCSRLLRQAYTHFPDASFMLFAGDLVSSSREEYWREFFYSGGWIFGMVPSLPTPGNHEYDKPDNQGSTFSKHWKQIYSLPENGPEKKFYDRVYFLDYQGVRFISVDSPAIGENGVDGKNILNWLDQTLSGNPNRWAVVFTHFPVYSCSQGRDDEKYRDAIKPILEKHGVDIVLQGHDHTYCRGQNLLNAGTGSKNKPMYIVSVAGPKMYGLNTSFWSDRMASNTQLYQHISFSGDTLSFRSFTAIGDLYDEFLLVKDKAGINRFIESGQVKKIGQRVQIPESAKRNYPEEETKKYQQYFLKK